jgi:hypothetical protein
MGPRKCLTRLQCKITRPKFQARYTDSEDIEQNIWSFNNSAITAPDSKADALKS